MIQFLIWPMLAVLMGIAILTLAGIVGTIAWCTVQVLRDVAAGSDGEIYCPVHQRRFAVHGVARHSTTGVGFARISTCAFWKDGRIRCARTCLKDAALAGRPAAA